LTHRLPEEAVRESLLEAGLTRDSAQKLLSILAMSDFDALQAELGADSPAVNELRELFTLAEAYGLADWLVLDLSVVRGLAYYTGVVFEGFDRSGELRAIFGGGRYDKLLGTFGGDDLPAAGFGFGDAVIVELLQDKGLLPDLATQKTGAVLVACQDEALRKEAMGAAAAMREANVPVDLVLEPKKPKWVFKHAGKQGTTPALSLHACVWTTKPTAHTHMHAYHNVSLCPCTGCLHLLQIVSQSIMWCFLHRVRLRRASCASSACPMANRQTCPSENFQGGLQQRRSTPTRRVIRYMMMGDPTPSVCQRLPPAQLYPSCCALPAQVALRYVLRPCVHLIMSRQTRRGAQVAGTS
jgi:hypothetical protein